MKIIFDTRKKSDFMKISYIIMLIILTFSVTLLIFGISDYQSKYDEIQIKSIRSAIFDSLITCYALEGKYPEDLHYLVENYGLIMNDNKYIYHYELFGSNILPEYDVIQYDGNNKKGSAFIYQEEDTP